VDGAFEAPSRNARDRCWLARDAFFACLEANGVVDAVRGEGKEIARRKCAAEDRELARECASSWVTYFKQRRVFEHEKQRRLEKLEQEGAKPLPEGTSLPGVSGR